MKIIKLMGNIFTIEIQDSFSDHSVNETASFNLYPIVLRYHCNQDENIYFSCWL